MNQHTPQEWADWTGCCVAQDEDEGFWMFPDKPKIDLISKCWGETDDFCICIPEELVEIPDDHKWTHLYEPRKADNAPHQSEVFIHKEYRIVKAHKEINPEAEIDARHEAFSAETAGRFDLKGYDYVIDAIDSLQDKMLLIRTACDAGVRLYSSMGAARKLDPTRVKVAEFWKVEGCPLARSLRQGFKKSGVRPSRKFQCVYSDELLPNAGTPQEPRANGSMVHITAVFGFTLAGLVIEDAVKAHIG